VSAIRVPWSSASFLVYTGGLAMLIATASMLGVQATEHGSGGLVVWALLVFVVLAALTFAVESRAHAVTAGLLGLSTLASFVILLGALLNWFGWLADTSDSPFEGFRVSFLFLELVTLVAAFVLWRALRFAPYLFVVAAAAWLFVADLISNGGDWTAIVTIFVGLALLVAAQVVDDVSAFWLHVAAGLAIGGGILWFLHDGSGDWIVVALIALVYIAFGDAVRRASWVVFGAWALLQAASFFAEKWSGTPIAFFPFFYLFPFGVGLDEYDETHAHSWAGPLTVAVAGAVLIGIGLYIARRRRSAVPEAELL